MTIGLTCARSRSTGCASALPVTSFRSAKRCVFVNCQCFGSTRISSPWRMLRLCCPRPSRNRNSSVFPKNGCCSWSLIERPNLEQGLHLQMQEDISNGEQDGASQDRRQTRG